MRTRKALRTAELQSRLLLSPFAEVRPMQRRLSVLILACALFSLGADSAPQAWMQFRGPNFGVAAGKLPTRWLENENVAWKVPLAGVGWSQPVVVGDKVFVTTAEAGAQAKPDPKNRGPGPGASFFGFGGTQPPKETYQWKVVCLDLNSGKPIWEKTAHQGQPTIPIHPNNSYASETPASDGERLVAYFGMTGVYCYDLAGDLLWQKELGSYPMQFSWGTGSSPILDSGRVYIQCDNDKESFLVALDAKTGDQIWRVKREEISNWSTPILWKNSQRSELVVAGGSKMRSYDPATGDLLWQMNASGRCSPSPVASGDALFVDSVDRLMGRSGILAAIGPGALGDISLKGTDTTGSSVPWSIKLAGYRLASPLVYQGCLYSLEQQAGIIKCLDAETGKEHYKQRLPETSGFTASPWAADGKIYCLDQGGATLVLEAGPKLNIVATNKLDGMFWASAGVAGNKLLLRSVEHLYCVEQ
jgi:outer membrane protein assembly factor BamB